MNKTYSLFIDTTQNYCNLAIINNNQIIDSVHLLTHNNMTDVVVEKISDLLNKNNINKKQITDIYLLNGPGSFTGCRVGYIIANAFVKIQKCKLHVMNSLLFQLPLGTGISVIDAKGKKVFIAIYDNYQEVLAPMMIEENKLIEYQEQYSKYKTYDNYSQVDVFKLLVDSLNYFDLIRDDQSFEPLYIKGFIS